MENLPQVVDCGGRGVVGASTGQGSGVQVGARESFWLASNAGWWEEEREKKMRTHRRVPIDWEERDWVGKGGGGMPIHHRPDHSPCVHQRPEKPGEQTKLFTVPKNSFYPRLKVNFWDIVDIMFIFCRFLSNGSIFIFLALLISAVIPSFFFGGQTVLWIS